MRLDAFYDVVHSRRDVRTGFLPDAPVDDAVLRRVLEAAHAAPSVGFSQPWDVVLVRDRAVRERVQALAAAHRERFAASLPSARARALAGIRTEAILDTPLNVVVTADPTRGGRHTLGRHARPEMAERSAVLAVQNLWLAARAEGLGVGWVSFFDDGALDELRATLDIPGHVEVVAYLCVGHVTAFPDEPELAAAGWARRRPLEWAVHDGRWGRRALPGEEPMGLLESTVGAITAPDPGARDAARGRLDRMTKPRGSLGRVEDLAATLAAIAGTCPPPVPEPAAVAVFAGDHGVHAQGVTPWPQEVTAQMVANFTGGGAVVNAFARQLGVEVLVVDVGVAAPLDTVPGLLPRKVAPGTADMTAGAAMTRAQATEAVEHGIEVARDLVAAGNRCLLTGDMGIANTTAAAALICAFTGAEPARVTGRGTGVDDATLAVKTDVVTRALYRHGLAPDTGGSAAGAGGAAGAPVAGSPGAGSSSAGSAYVGSSFVGSSDAGLSATVRADTASPDTALPATASPATASPAAADPLAALAAVGGFEHAALAGFVLGGAALRVPVLLDGVSAGAAALVAAALAPDAVGYCLAGHRSVEPGSALASAFLGLDPLLDMEMRLGEGTGALLALPLLQGAARALADVATFDSAGVTDKTGEPS